MILLTAHTLIAGLVMSFMLSAADNSAAGELYEYPGAYWRQSYSAGPSGKSSAAGAQLSQAKPKLRFHQPFTSIVMQDPAPHLPNVNSPKMDAGKGALATGDQAKNGSTQSYIAGPLWNSKPRTTTK